MSNYFYDCEFIEDGRTIDLISIGIVAEDGDELYLVNQDAPWRRIRKHEWLMANVVPHLPRGHGDWRNHMPRRWLVDFDDVHVQRRGWIASRVEHFLYGRDGPPELWAYYGAYDYYVCLMQLFGVLADKPAHLPMYTHDLQQELDRLGIADDELPPQTGQRHNALEDARWVHDVWLWLRKKTDGQR